MKLTDPEIKAAKPKEKRYSLPDGKGLILWVQLSISVENFPGISV